MKQYIFKSTFRSDPEASERNHIHFKADLKFAIRHDYEYIQDSNGTVFDIISPTELRESDVTEEGLQLAAEQLEQVKSKLTPDGTTTNATPEKEPCIHEHNISRLDQLIRAALDADKISNVDVLELVQARVRLGEAYGI